MRSVKNPSANVSAVLSVAIYAAVITENLTARCVFPNHLMTVNRHEHFMSMALKEASYAFEKHEVPVGSLIVVENQVVAAAHNGKQTDNDPTAHAELLTIRESALALGDWRLDEATLYVTKEPCIMCAGAMINARLGRLVYGCIDTRFGAVNSRYQLLHDPGLNHQVSVVSGILEEQCADLLKKFFEIRR